MYYLRILPGAEAEYDRRHKAIWPELAQEIRESGFSNMSGFRRGTDVWYYQEAEPDTKTAFAMLNLKPANRRWDRFFRDVIAEVAASNDELLWYKETFHGDGLSLKGACERGLFGYVIDPDRGGDYDAIYAEYWPAVSPHILDAGLRNYSGFRRGAHAVHYGEFFPDMATVFERLGSLDRCIRWTRALDGIITTVTTADNQLITADEVFHQD